MKYFLLAIFVLSLLGFLAACTYTAPYRLTRLAKSGSLAPDHPVIVTISGVEHKPGQRKAFFRDTRAVLSELPRQPGLLGYSYKFQLIGNKAWTQTAWVDEAARDGFAKSRTHRAAVQNSRQTSQKARFVTVTRPLSSLPMSWSEALERIQKSDERTDD